ncbi:MAG: COG1361 S-layer family protein [Candidatus Woesearchaeota archaeon]
MRRYTILIALVLLLSSIVAAQEYTYISNSDILTLSLVNQDPDPAIAGNIVELRIGVENFGAKLAQDKQVELVLGYPLESVPGETYVKSAGTLQGFQVDADQKIIKFKVRTDREASEGTYEFDVLLYNEGERNTAAAKKTLSIDINNRESAEVIYIDKVKLVPGQQTPMEFTINNVGNAPLRDMSFSWSNADDIVLPVGSSDTKYVKYLGVGEKVTISYDVIADTNALPGLYKLELSLTYEDSVTGQLTAITNNAGVYVGGETDFDISFSETSAGETSFSISNIGSNPASSVSVIIPKQDGWSTTGSNSVIIGNLNKGDYTVASFMLQQGGTARSAGANIPSREGFANMSDEERAQLRYTATAISSNELKIDIAYTDTMGNREVVEKSVPMQTSMQNATGSAMGTRFAGGRPGAAVPATTGTSTLTKVIYTGVGIILLIIIYRLWRRGSFRTIKKRIARMFRR